MKATYVMIAIAAMIAAGAPVRAAERRPPPASPVFAPKPPNGFWLCNDTVLAVESSTDGRYRAREYMGPLDINLSSVNGQLKGNDAQGPIVIESSDRWETGSLFLGATGSRLYRLDRIGEPVGLWRMRSERGSKIIAVTRAEDGSFRIFALGSSRSAVATAPRATETAIRWQVDKQPMTLETSNGWETASLWEGPRGYRLERVAMQNLNQDLAAWAQEEAMVSLKAIYQEQMEYFARNGSFVATLEKLGLSADRCETCTRQRTLSVPEDSGWAIGCAFAYRMQIAGSGKNASFSVFAVGLYGPLENKSFAINSRADRHHKAGEPHPVDRIP